MDIARPGASNRSKQVRRLVFGTIAAIVLVGMTVALASLKPAGTQNVSIDRTTSVAVDKNFGYKVTKVGMIDGYYSYVIEADSGLRYLVFRDNVIPLTK